ncbi:MAG: LacI family DNA-binding transcriptional regulator [Eubacteriales bacterium]
MAKSINASDIAKIAGVSRSTVSRVINNYGNVTEETREKVLEVIKKFNYVPHASAQMLAGKKSIIIGLFIIDTKDEKDYNKMTTSTYFSPFTNAVIDEANKRHYKILISIINNKQDFKNAKTLFYNKTISGGIFIGNNNNEIHIKEIINNGFKVAIIEQETGLKSFSECIIVNSDSFWGAYKSTKYLIDLGHKKIAHICGDMKHLTASLKLKGYKQAIIDSGIEIDEDLIFLGDYTGESGYIIAKEIAKSKKPTAIFVANDGMTIGVYKAFKELGIRIPEDISIIGFDNIEIARYLQPSLTTVKVPFFEMAHLASKNLFQAIENKNRLDSCTTYNVPVKMIIRDSCMKQK